MNLQVHSAGANIHLGSGTEFFGAHRMSFGDNVWVSEAGTFAIVYERAVPGPMITIGSGVWMNKRCYLQAANEIVIGEKVIFAPDVYIADSAYDYRDVGVPVMSQGLQSIENRVHIGAGTWLGIRVAVMGNVRIGIGSVVGANAVVTHDIPDYCVAVGQPARVVRAYDSRVRSWVRIDGPDQLAEVLANRIGDIPPQPDAPPRIPMAYMPLVKIP